MRPGEYKPRAKAKAIALVRDKGYSYAAAGKEIGGATRDSVKRWCDAAGVQSTAANARAEIPASPYMTVERTPLAAPADAEPSDSDDLDLSAMLRDMRTQLRWIKGQASEAARDGNTGLASKLSKHAVDLANTLARIAEKQSSTLGSNGRVVTDDDLQAAEVSLTEKFDKLRDSHEAKLGLCPECGARLRMLRASAPDAGKEV